MQTLLGHIERWLAYSQAPLEDCAGEKEVREQLKFENLVPEEEKTPEIIYTLPGKFQPRKVEELLPDIDIAPDTYMIYPTGGYHPFYGVPNTFPRYQLPIWPYIKRIKYDHGPNRGVRHPINFQANILFAPDGYPVISLKRSAFRTAYSTRENKTRQTPKDSLQRFHRLIALAWIPNPKNKPFVLHDNDDLTNYLIENLKWGTASENMREKILKRPDTVEQKYLNAVLKGYIKG